MTIKVTATASANAVLSGIFLGEGGAPPAARGDQRSAGQLGGQGRLGRL